MTSNKVRIVTQEEYLPERLKLLEKEKALTRARDSLVKERQELPIVEVTKRYTFTDSDSDGKKVSKSLEDLFDGREQLLIYHFMFAPSADSACESCTLHGEALSSQIPHFNARGVTFVCVSRAPIEKIEAYKQRLGFTFPWVSSFGNSFNQDYQVTQLEDDLARQYNFASYEVHLKHNRSFFTKGEQPGASCFIMGTDKNGIGKPGTVYHTYSAYARGIDTMTPVLQYLDITKLGRRDAMVEKVGGIGFRRRDEYTADELKGIWD